MTVDMPTRTRIGKAVVIPLTNLVNQSLEKRDVPEELTDRNLRYILIDAQSYVSDSRIADPIGSILDYALMAKKAGKKVIVFGIEEVGDRNLRLSKGYKALSALSVDYNREGLPQTLDRYCL